MDQLPHSVGLASAEQLSQIDSFPVKEIIDQLLGIVRRHYPIIVLIWAGAIAFSLVYLITTPKLYTAHAQFLIDTSKMQVLPQQQQVVGVALGDAQVATEIEVLKSDRIGLSVIKDLKLTEDPEFVGSQRGFIGAIFGLLFSPFSSGANPQGALSEDALTGMALGRYLSHRGIQRVGDTYVLDIAYTSLNPGRAAQVANAIADAYLADKLDAKFESSRRARKWLEDRVGEMRLQAMAADSAVLEFKEKNGIFSTASGTNTDGPLLVDQGVADLNAQLAKARAATAEAKARLDRIQTIMKDDVPDAAVTDSLSNPIISQLRTQYLEYDRRYQLYAARYGATHLAVINLQTQMTQLRRSIADELNQIAESYKSNYEIAQASEQNLQTSLAKQIAGSQLTNRERLGLSELESKAKVYHAAHDSFLQQFMEITQQQSLPVTEARTISAATAGGQTSPNTSRILFLASAFGLMLSFAAAYLRDSIDNVFRTAKQVEQVLRTNCLSVLPILKKINLSDSPSPLDVKNRVSDADGSAKEISRDVGPLRRVIDEPLSVFAEGFRSVKVAADISGSIKRNKVIGITSSLPHEGKSTVASNFAELIAHGGSKVILIDGDLRNPALTRKLAPEADVGLLQVLGGKAELGEAVYTDNSSGLSFLPAVIESRLAHSSEILASEAFRQLIDGLRKTYDYIVVDFPPLAPVVDVRGTINIVDLYVFVIEWGRTRIKMVQRQLGSAPEICDRLLGVVLNKANTKLLSRYEDYYGSYYYRKNYYAAYGYTK